MNLTRIPLFYISLTEKEIKQLHYEIKTMDLEGKPKPKLLEIYNLLDIYNSV